MTIERALIGTTDSTSKTYIEDVFSTYMYTGNGTTQTITNGIDLAGKGGMVWIKGRSGTTDHALYDTARGATYDLVSNTTAAQTTQSTGLTAFGSTGCSIGALAKLNTNAATYAAWTFRKSPKFFDVVTYTGDGQRNRNIPHNLGAVPGFIIIKEINTSDYPWSVYHRSAGSGTYGPLELNLNTSAAAFDNGDFGSSHTASTFQVAQTVPARTNNGDGRAYVAYLFAHDTTSDGLIQCGSYTGNGTVANATTEQSGPEINLGWEPQYVMIKNSSAADGWWIFDTIRGFNVNPNGPQQGLYANTTGAETSLGTTYVYLKLTSTGFKITAGTGAYFNESGATYFYMAIRRGPMRTPTDATKVLTPSIWTGDGSARRIFTSPNLLDFIIIKRRTGTILYGIFDRLRGANQLLNTSASDAEVYTTSYLREISPGPNNGYALGGNLAVNGSGYSYCGYIFSRAPGFFDVVCYTGTGAEQTLKHNLGVVPELWIIKCRNDIQVWRVGGGVLGSPTQNYTALDNSTIVPTIANVWQNPTSTTFGIGTAYPSDGSWNASGFTYVAYLFATCPGVSKVGSYTGNGSSQTINCGFAAGVRFVLIRRNDVPSDWYVWDTARGIVSANDPHLSLNTNAAEVTTDDSIDPDSTGFIVNQVAATNVNVTSATYIYLAIA